MMYDMVVVRCCRAADDERDNQKKEYTISSMHIAETYIETWW